MSHLGNLFYDMRMHALADPSARADHPVAPHRVLIEWRSARWSVILTVNR